MPLPTVTFGALRDETLEYLGDPVTQPASARLWSVAEAETQIREGYERLCALTACLWDALYLDEYANVGNFNEEFERVVGFFAGEVFYVRGRVNAAWEIAYCGDETAAGIESRVQSWWERDYFDDAGAPSAISLVPVEMNQLERVAYDGLRVDALSQQEIARWDPRFQLAQGWFSAYIFNRDGLRALRKYMRPARASQYPQQISSGDRGMIRSADDDGDLNTATTATVYWVHLDEFARVIGGGVMGVISAFDCFHVDNVTTTSTQASGFGAISEFAGWTIPRARGVLRRLPGYHPSGVVMRGIPKRLSRDYGNTKIEFTRRPLRLSKYTDVLEIPDHWTRYIRFYALHRLFLKDGPGFDLALSKHYKDRWERGVGRVIAWMTRTYKARLVRMGGAVPAQNPRGARPVLPWNFGRPTGR